MSLYHDLIAWEGKLMELLEQTRELTTRVRQLEQQNQYLQQSHVEASFNNGGLEALTSLYDEGFHICHAHFAETREEDCLFCLSLMHHGLKVPETGEEEEPPDAEREAL